MYQTVLTLTDTELQKYNMLTLDQFLLDIQESGRVATNQIVIGYYKTFLIQTDYIISKLSEMYLQGVSTLNTETEYQKVLDSRKLVREEINRLQKENNTNV